jgi:hypothetical protein
MYRSLLPARLPALALATMCIATSSAAADRLDEFSRTWTGRRVMVRSTLYTAVYDEVGRLGRHYRGRLAGLTVATTAKHYYEFDGPGSDDDIVDSTPGRVFEEMGVRYHRAYHLDIGTVKTITPVMLRQYDPGVALIVDSVRTNRNRIRIDFRPVDPDEDEFATSLTIEWPVPFSKGFGERDSVENVILRFVGPV